MSRFKRVPAHLPWHSITHTDEYNQSQRSNEVWKVNVLPLRSVQGVYSLDQSLGFIERSKIGIEGNRSSHFPAQGKESIQKNDPK